MSVFLADLDRFYIEIVYNGTWTAAEEQLVRSQADRSVHLSTTDTSQCIEKSSTIEVLTIFSEAPHLIKDLHTSPEN